MTLRTNATRPGQRWLALVVGVLALMLGASAVVLALISDSGTYDITRPNSGSSETADLGYASVEYIGSSASNQSSGTGLFDPFLRLQGSPTEKGYNTNGPVAFETKPGTWTKAILASAIPVVDCGGDLAGTLCWELFVDINEGNNAKRVSLNDVEVWLTTNPNLVGYVEGTGWPAGTATQVYDFSGAILINDVNQGSGRGDLRYLIPVQTFAAGDYFVLYSKWGTTSGTAGTYGTGGYASEGGFEEWKVRKAPNLSILKTAVPAGPVSAGTTIGFNITVTNSGAAAAPSFTITDTLPTGGGGLNWSLDPAFAGCSISATTPQVLTCTFAGLASGASIGPIHLSSPTTAADCGVVSNTAFLSTGGSSTATVTVQCGALQITKTAKHADGSGDTSANLDATFTITGPSPSTTTRTLTTGADGVGCIEGLAFGDYNVAETTVPAGYGAPAATTVTVNNVAGCSDATFVGEALGVENVPQTDVTITIDSLHDGATSTLIECWGPGSDPATDAPDYSTTVSDGSLSIEDLDPTDPAITLNCQITVDP
jgi:uncharacterized repeat protein (TIGR01451 family)